MAKIKRFTTADGGYHGELGFLCPGCKEIHFINDSETELQSEEHYKAMGFHRPDIWTFNNDFESPTIRASVLTRRYCFNSATGKHDKEIERCHSFVTDGNIQFLSDCQHALAGQTVELPQIMEDKTE